jgi:hypothetical protein
VSATAERGCLLIADISGYTDYVVASPLEYAEDVVADITRDLVHRLEPVVRVNKLEWDAPGSRITRNADNQGTCATSRDTPQRFEL